MPDTDATATPGTTPQLLDDGPPASPAVAGRPYGGRTQADRVAERRRRFIDAGIQVFGQHGYRGATVRGLCAQAGLTDRYFYESFDSVQALLEAVYLHQVNRLRLAMRQMQQQAPADDAPVAEAAEPTATTVAPGAPAPANPSADTPAPLPDPWAAIKQVLHTGLSLWFDLVRDPLFARVVLVEVLGVGPTVDSLHEAAAADFAVFMVSPLHLLPSPPPATDTERLLVGHALAGSAVQLGRQWLASGYRQPREALVNSAVLVCLAALQSLARVARSR